MTEPGSNGNTIGQLANETRLMASEMHFGIPELNRAGMETSEIRTEEALQLLGQVATIFGQARQVNQSASESVHRAHSHAETAASSLGENADVTNNQSLRDAHDTTVAASEQTEFVAQEYIAVNERYEVLGSLVQKVIEDTRAAQASQIVIDDHARQLADDFRAAAEQINAAADSM